MKLPTITKATIARLAIPIALVVAWFAVTAIGGPYFGRVSEVSSNDLAAYLPRAAESTKVKDQVAMFYDTNSIPAIVVFESATDTLSAEQQAALRTVATELSKVDGVSGDVSPPIVSEDGKAAIIVVPLATDAPFKEAFPALTATLNDAKLTVTYKIGGPASFARDLESAFGAIDVTLLLVALGVVFVILLIVYRSPVLPLLVLIASMGALTAAIFVVWHLAKADIVQLNGQTQGILFILAIGAATDYSLLYIARLREEYHNHHSNWQAAKTALKGSFEPILAAGGTVIVGLLCLLLSDLGSNKALGPIGGIGVAFAMLSSMTFLPAMLLLVGRAAFWPKRPEYDVTHAETYESRHPFWAKVGEFVAKSPRKIWIVTLGLLLVACIGFFQLKADGVAQSDFVLGKSEARDAQKLLDKHFPGGSGSPAYVVASQSRLNEVVAVLEADQEVASVSVTATNAPGDSMPVGEARERMNQRLEQSVRAKFEADPQVQYLPEEQKQATLQTILVGANPYSNASPKVIDGNALLQVTLKDAADSSQAKQAIVRLRQAVKTVDAPAMVGGTSAIQYDTNQASMHDRRLIIPVILLAITLILIVLLRSLVAPLVLLATTIVSFGATLGLAALLFNHILKFPGADPTVILFGFVFLVALGIDYNIFLMTRVREETLRRGVAKGTIKGLVVTGGVITSAGIVLAATFAALGVIPILFLAQLAFIVAFGVLLDTIVVRSLLVPALTLDIGKPMWWPSHISKRKGK
ncbi:MAG: MMPL family transporter [Candidatus Saccharimonas sp.]